MRLKRSGQIRLGLAIVGLLLMLVLIARIGPHAIAAQFSRIGPEVAWLLVPYGIGTAIGAFPWAWYLPAGVRPTLRAVVASRFAASGANAMLPFFGLAGEPARLLWLRADARAAGVAATIADRLVYNSGSGLFLMLGAIAALATSTVHYMLGVVAAMVALVILAITLGLAFVVSRFGVVRWVQQLLRRFLGGMYARGEFGETVEAELRRLLDHERPALWRGVWVHLASRVAIGVEVYIALRVLEVPAGVGSALILATVPVATGLVGSAIPSQLGVQEGGFALTCQALGIDPAVGFTLVLLQRLRQLVYVCIGPVLIAGARPAIANDAARDAPREPRRTDPRRGAGAAPDSLPEGS